MKTIKTILWSLVFVFAAVTLIAAPKYYVDGNGGVHAITYYGDGSNLTGVVSGVTPSTGTGPCLYGRTSSTDGCYTSFVTAEVVVTGGTCSTTYTVDPTVGTMFTLSLNGACQIGVTNLAAGQSYSMLVTQLGTTAPTFTAAHKWASGTAPTWSTSATKYDVVACVSFDGTTLKCSGIVDLR